MKAFRYTMLLVGMMVGLGFSEALAQSPFLMINGTSGDGNTDISLMIHGIDLEGDSTHQKVRVHLVVKQKKVTTLNYINKEASISVIGGRALVVDLQGSLLPDGIGNSEGVPGLSISTKGVGTLQVFFNQDFSLTDPPQEEDALVLTANLSQAGSVDCLLWDIACCGPDGF